MRPNRLIALLLVLSLNSAGLSQPAFAVTKEQPEKEKKGLRFRLSQGTGQPEAPTKPSTRSAVTVLSDADTEKILKRLPDIKPEKNDEQTFALREKSLPPPRTGSTVKVNFPSGAAADPPEADAGPPKVLRIAPEGRVPLAANLSITFSQPMVSIASQEDARRPVPVKLSPQPQGQWRWIGTRTLQFEPQQRFAMATDYVVTVPAGMMSASGARLETESSVRFSTPAPTLTNSYPPEDETQQRNPLMFVEFDQRIDPVEVLKTIRIRAGSLQFNARLATNEEVRSNEEVRKLTERAVAGHWLAFLAVNQNAAQPSNTLPPGGRVSVSIGPATPSAEGPKRTTKAQTFSFEVHGPLRVVGHDCNEKKRCEVNDSFDIKFTNTLDEASFKKSAIKIEPAIEGMDVSISDDMISIEGNTQARTLYRVKLDPNIKDEFGQSLGSSQPNTFYVGPRRPLLSAPEDSFAVLNPFGPASFSVYTVNYSSVKARLYSVQPEDYPKWLDYQFPVPSKSGVTRAPMLPGKLVSTRAMPVHAKSDEIVETPIDLEPALTGGHGQMILVVESPDAGPRNGHGFKIEVWLQRTDIGLDAFVDKTQLVGWATSLRDGAPLANVELAMNPIGTKGTTGADGTARLALPAQEAKQANLLVARKGDDVAILPERTERWGTSTSWFRKPNDTLRWFVFDDRKIYRPGEEVHLKGWIRRIDGEPRGDMSVPGTSNMTTDLVYTVKDSSSIEIVKAGTRLSPTGGFDCSIKLPETINLGGARIEFLTNSSLSGSSFTHEFQVQEFRRPEFEVEAQVDSSGPFVVGAGADLSVKAKFYSGGELSDAPARWSVTAIPGQFTPPNRSDFTFGKWVPWWGSTYDSTKQEQIRNEVFTGKTDQSGKHRLHIDFDSVDPVRPTVVTAEASVTDVNRQAWSSTTTLLVHPADLYVGLRSSKMFVQQGQPLLVESIVTDIEGQAVAKSEIRMHVALLEWGRDPDDKDKWIQIEKNPQDCSVISGSGAVNCNFQTIESGQYRVRATVRDQRGRANESELTLWVAGTRAASEREYSLQEVKLIPDKKDYHDGDTAEILVQAHLYPAEGMVTLLRSGVLKTEPFHMDGPTYTLRIPIEGAWTPNLTVQVHLTGSLDRGQGKEPSFASGELNLPIPPLERKLQVMATPRDRTLQPGAETEINVDVTDAGGRTVSGSEVAVLAVDESVLALTDYELADPLAAFYANRSADTTHHRLRSEMLTHHPPEEREQFITSYWLRRGGGGPGGGFAAAMVMPRQGLRASRGYLNFSLARASESKVATGLFTIVTKSGTNETVEEKQIRLRENFAALALFAPSVMTDAKGHASVKLKLPDSLTRYRVMAVAVAGGKQFGAGESNLTAQMPLMVRPSAPRFLNIGDQFELPIVVQNQTSQPLTVDLGVRAVNAVFVESPQPAVNGSSARSEPPTTGRRVTVPANDRVEVRVPATTIKPGLARFQLSAVSGEMSDAASVFLPVWTPATTESFATYGELDEGAIAQTVNVPRDIASEYGGLEVETSSTQLQQLTDAVLYLTNYPYECSEQLSSRIIGIAALRDVLTSFHAKDLPSASELESIVARDLKRLQALQNDDGGFGFWKQGDESWPYLTIHVAHALARAKQKKFSVQPAMLEKVSKYLQKIESHIPARYGPGARRALIAYALYTRAQLGDRDPSGARKLIASAGLDSLSVESVGWLLSVLAGDKASKAQLELIRRYLNNRVTETAATAHFVSDYKDGNYLLLNSKRRTDAVLLEALIADQKTNDLIPKLVRGLLEQRTRGRWTNTQENAFVLLALDRYFNTYEKVTPNFVARVWLGEAYAGEQKFEGRATDRQDVKVPMSYLMTNAPEQRLTLSKEGAGRLYYRIGMDYAPSDLNLKSISSGFTVERSYEPVDHPDDVRCDADGTWRIKAGARVRVRLTLFAPSERYHVALADPLPAGFEALNPSLAVTQKDPEDEQQRTDRQLLWFDYQNLRDERTEAFTSRLRSGAYQYSYVARATTPGVFIVAPVKAEEMYHPETYGRGNTDRVRIE